MISPAELPIEQAQDAVRVCACFNLRRTTRVITQIYDEALAPTGLSSGQYQLLLVVRLLGGSSLQKLANAVSSDRSVMSRTVRPLVLRGYLAMETGRDRRTRAITLTPEGQRALAEGYPLWQKAQARTTSRIGAAQLEQLLAVSTAVLTALNPPRTRGARALGD